MKYVYFISFDAITRVGNCELKFTEKIESISDIRETEKWLRESQQIEWAVITNFILLRTEE